MKLMHAFKIVVLAIASLAALALVARAQTVTFTNYDSVVALATNVTKNYAFTDPTNGLSVVVAVTMTPYSRSNASPAFTLLDYNGGVATRLGVDSGTGSGDGNWVDGFEGVNFTASLVSVSSGVITNSVLFGITGLGIRLESGFGTWTSTANTSTNVVAFNGEQVDTLDTNTVALLGANYNGQLRNLGSYGQFQLSDSGSLAGQSVVLKVTFTEAASPEKIYVASGSGYVDAFSSSGARSVFASGLGGLQGVGFDTAGNLYVVDQAHNLVEKYNTNGVGTVFTTNLNNPIGLAIDSANNLYVNNFNGSFIEKFTSSGVGTLFAMANGNLQGMAFDSAGNLYLAEYSNNRIRRFDTNGNNYIFTSSTNISGPQGIAFDAAGNLYVANNNLNTIEKFSPAGVDLGIFANTDYGPYGLAFDSAGNLYVSSFANKIEKITPAGTVYEFASDNDGPSYLAIWPGLKPTNTVYNPPTITTNPANQTVCGNSVVSFAAASGTPASTVQWQMQANGGSSFANIPGATNTTLTFLTVNSDNGSQFKAVFSNAGGSTTSTAATLTVNASADATITLSPGYVIAGSPGNSASAPHATGVTYSWSITNGTITSAANISTITFTAGTSGNVSLGLTTQNSSCANSGSVTVPITPATVSASYGNAQITSWFTGNSGKYARIYTTDANKTNGISTTTWTNTSTQTAQAIPTYAGVQEVDYSTNWIYMRTPDLAEYIMGPWYNDATRTTNFIAYPTNQHVLFALPRTATLTNPPAVKTVTYGPVDVVGYFVDGIAMFDALDGWVWNGSAEVNGGNYQWRRAAYPNESVTFDPSNSHQQNTGEYHNHADPIGLRYTLGDNVNFNPVTKLYSESTNASAKHSPILGWVRDGYPIYGPYGYSNPTNSASGIRRMTSGYQLRNGQNGSDNLTTAGRATLPAWMLRNNGNTAQSGPSVSTTYPLGRYLQDYSYLGDLANAATGLPYELGVDFDLNEYDCRWCVTPEFPGGTYAYFITIDSNGVPIAPWNIGMFFFGTPTGYKATNITEIVKTNFIGVPRLPAVMNDPIVKNSTVTLTWSATEGGTYQVQSTTNLSGSWTTNATNVSAVLNAAGYTNTSTSSARFYRVAQTALAPYDSVGISTNSGGGASTLTMTPTSGNRNSTISVKATFSSTVTPPVPTQSGAPVQSFTVGTLSVSSASYTYSNGTGSVTGSLTIPSNATTGSQTVTIKFSPPPGQTNGLTYTQANGFTIN